MDIIFISWWALKMTFSCIPGLCLVSYLFQCGFEQKKFRLKSLILFWKDVNKAKKDGIKEFGKIFFPKWVFIGSLIINLVLLFIPGDNIIVIAANMAALPSCLFSYYIGKKSYNSKKFIEKWEWGKKLWEVSKKMWGPDGDPFYIINVFAGRVLLIFGFWVLLCILFLVVANLIGIWGPK